MIQWFNETCTATALWEKPQSHLNYTDHHICLPTHLHLVHLCGWLPLICCCGLCVVCVTGCVSNNQIVKEYERAVIFRLGRITDRKPKGPGSSFHLLLMCIYTSTIFLRAFLAYLLDVIMIMLFDPIKHWSKHKGSLCPETFIISWFLESGNNTNTLCFSPGLFFVLPCTDTLVKVDLRTVSFDIPPQEVRLILFITSYVWIWICVSHVS